MLLNTFSLKSNPTITVSFENKAYKLEEEAISLSHKMRSGIKHRVDEITGQLWICIENPRNEIDNPLHYCTQPFNTLVSTFVVSSVMYAATSAIEDLFKEYQKVNYTSLWSAFIRSTAKIKETIQTNINIPAGAWEWYKGGEIPMAEYYVLAYLNSSISADAAIQLSGLNEVEFAQMVQEKAMERDLPIFRDYLKGETVEDRLPFSEEKSSEFRRIMEKELD